MDSLTICRPIAAIIVACLASFRQLFMKSEHNGLKRQSENPHLCDSGPFSYFQSLKSITTSGRRGLSSQESDIERVFTSSRKPISTKSKIPIDAIYVRKDVNISLGDERHDTQETKVNHYDPWNLPSPSLHLGPRVE